MHRSRRDFLKSGLALGILGGVGGRALAQSGKRYATDMVPLGSSGVKVTRLAFGTGTHGGRVQRELGQESFTRLVRHAYDSGIRFFETAESYPGMPEMLSIALKGIPRDSYQLMHKYTTPRPVYEAAATIEQFRKQCNTDYFDILLLHCVKQPTWAKDLASASDDFSEAKGKSKIRAIGASVHGLPALRQFPGNRWLDVAMIRMNHNGARMDGENPNGNVSGKVSEVVQHAQAVHAQGAGVISMKLVGEGTFTDPEDRQKALNHTMNLGCIDTVTLGFKSTAEVDEAIERMNRALNLG